MAYLNYLNLYTTYSDRLRESKNIESIRDSIFNRKTIPDKYKDILFKCVVQNVYRSYLETMLNGNKKAEVQLLICKKLVSIDKEIFNVAFIMLAKAFMINRGSALDILWYIQNSSIAELNRIKLKNIEDLDYKGLREFIITYENTSPMQCSVCGRELPIHLIRVGHTECRECFNLKRSTRQNKSKKQTDDTECSLEFKKEPTDGAVDSKKHIESIITSMKSGICNKQDDISFKINRLRQFYIEECDILFRLEREKDPNIEILLCTLENINELMRKEIDRYDRSQSDSGSNQT